MGLFTILTWILVSLTFITGAFNLGLDSANITGTYPNIVSEFPHLRDVLTRNIVISNFCGAILGSVIYIYSDAKKKSAFAFGDMMLIFGSIILYYCTSHERYLYFAQAFIGFGSGILTVAGPVLIGEACSRKARGAVVATGGFFLNVGMYFSSVLVDLIPMISWRVCLSSISIPAFLQLLLVLFTPKVAFENENSKRLPKLSMSLYASILIQICQLSVGHRFIFVLAPKIIQSDSLLNWVSLISSLMSFIIFKLFKRRTILISSVSVIAIDLLLLSLVSNTSEEAVVLVLIFVAAFNAALANLPTAYALEALEPRDIGRGCGTLSFLNYVISLIITLVQDDQNTMLPHVGQATLLKAYAVISAVFMTITAILMPETLDENKGEATAEESK